MTSILATRRGTALVVPLLAALALAACAQPRFDSPGGQEATSAAEAGRAFGRVLLFEDGKEVEFNILGPLQLHLQSTRTGEIQRVEFMGGDGRFSWPLPPGEYVIVAVRYLRWTGRIWTTFSVPGPRQAVYIGDLRIERSRHGYRFSVRDAYADALENAAAELTKEGLTPVKALMRLEERVGFYRRVTDICSVAEWGIDCDLRNRGVKPLSPMDGVERHSTTDSLTPRFAWTPAPREGVTYDVAIHESLSLPGLRRVRGAVVRYSERLKEASFEPATPLAPGQRYEWSVRLRSGETVSSWSTTGYFVFFVVGWAAGSGDWFVFATPGGQ